MNYHDVNEIDIGLIQYLIGEMEKEEKEAKDCHLPYQSLLKFFYDVRNIINA